MSAPTPGPWLRAGHTVYALALDERGHPCNRFTALLQSARRPHGADDQELMANAALMRSAPDLLDALEHVAGLLAGGVPPDDAATAGALREARAAIARARGP